MYYDCELSLLVCALGGMEKLEDMHLFEYRGPSVPGDSSFEDAVVVDCNTTVQIKSAIRVVQCKEWPILKRMVDEEEGMWTWVPDSSSHFIFLRSTYSSLMQHPEVYDKARAMTSFSGVAGLTCPSKDVNIWNERLQEVFVEPAQQLVKSMHADNYPDDKEDILVPFTIQLMKYSKGAKQFVRTSHHDPKAYEYIVTCGLKGCATVELKRVKKLWIQPVSEGEMYILGGPGVWPWKHKVVCHGVSDRIVAVLRFVRHSTLLPLIKNVLEEKRCSAPRQTRASAGQGGYGSMG